MWLLDKLLRKLIAKGELIVVSHDGREYRYGAPDPDHGPIRARLTDRKAVWDIAKDAIPMTWDYMYEEERRLHQLEEAPAWHLAAE